MKKKKNTPAETRPQIWAKRYFSLCLSSIFLPYSHRVFFHQDCTAYYELLMIFRSYRFRDGCLSALLFQCGIGACLKIRLSKEKYFRFSQTQKRRYITFSRQFERPNDLFNSDVSTWYFGKLTCLAINFKFNRINYVFWTVWEMTFLQGKNQIGKVSNFRVLFTFFFLSNKQRYLRNCNIFKREIIYQLIKYIKIKTTIYFA